MEIDTVQDEDDREETQTEVGDCAERSVLRLDEHGSENECDTAGGTGRTLQKSLVKTSIETQVMGMTNQKPV
jgi:hypothetical protein